MRLDTRKRKTTKKLSISLLTALILSISFPVEAARFQAGEMTFGINGFLGVEYTYMDGMPMVMEVGGTPMIMRMDSVSFLSMRHLNLLFTVEKDNFRALINLHSNNLFETNDDQDTFKGSFGIQEAYGEYTFYNGLRVRAGEFLVPFGIYNDVRYILPVFSTVVLPHIYEPPRNYSEPIVAEEGRTNKS